MKRWSMADLKAKGIHVKTDGKAAKLNVPKRNSSGKDLIEFVLKASGIEYKTEYKFHPTRRWRVDWYIPSAKTIVEYEGLMSAKSRHTTISGFAGDCEKYNAASLMGFRLLRYTALNANCFAADLNKILQQ